MIEVKIRDGDYYGGDLTVELDEPDEYSRNFETHTARIVWRSWGQYGGASIELTDKEAIALGDALLSAPWREAVSPAKGKEG